MPSYQTIAIACLILINVMGYALMCFDKFRAKQKGTRVSENTLFTVAFLLGAMGIYLGMKAPMYHKAAKAKFRLGIPVLIVLNAVSVYVMYKIR